MNSIKKYFLYAICAIVSLLTINSNVLAADYDFSMIPYNVTTACDLELDGGQVCFEKAWNGELDSYRLNDGVVEANQNIMILLHVKATETSALSYFRLKMTYDTTKVTPFASSYGLEYGNISESDNAITMAKQIFPYSGRKNPTWTTSTPTFQDGYILTVTDSGDDQMPFVSEGNMYALFFTINDTVTPGSTINFNYSLENPSKTTLSDIDFNELADKASFNNLTLSVYSNVSVDGTLSTLTAKGSNNTDYPFGFVASSKNDLEYYLTVPNSVDKITFAGTSTDPNVKNIIGLDTANNLTVGDNQFTIAITAQSGDVTTYTMHVRRLSNDATLSNVTFTNGVSFPALADGIFDYETTVPYKTKSTIVTALTNHAQASIYSGTGSWSISSDNNTTTTNNYKIVVNAEDCNYTEEQVPGNVCTTKTYNFKISRTAPSKNVDLNTLTVDGVSVPNFDPSVTEYTLDPLSNDKTSLVISATVADPLNSIESGVGTKTVEVGDNTYDVVVKSEDGVTTKTYTIKVRRLSNVTTLKSLTVESNPQGTLSPVFTPSFAGTYTYTYDPTVTLINISATVEDLGNAQIAIVDRTTDSSATGTNTLNTASASFGIETTDVVVIVTAEDGTIETYPISLNRLKSSNNYLSELSLSEGTLSPAFTSGNRSYTASVDGSVTSVEVTAKTAVDYAEVVRITGNTNLQFGVNTIEVVVRAEDGTEASYIVNLTREKYTIATLDSLTVDGVSVPEFEPNKFEYTLDNVPYEKNSVEVDATLTNSYATVTGLGNITLNTQDNVIEVKVKSHDGNVTNTYKINIYREQNSDNTVLGLSVAGVVPTLKEEGIYEVTLPNSKDVLNPSDVVISASPDATIVKSESIELSTKNVNNYQFSITSESGETKNYVILVTRTKSNDTNISKVTLTIGDDSSRYCLMDGDSCKIAVPVDTTDFSLSSTIHPEASISPANGTMFTMSSSESTKSITLTVTAEDGTNKDYTVIVERQKSSNNNLSDLTVDGVTVPNFKPDTQVYNIIVPGLTTEVTIGATVADTNKATIETDLSNPFTLNFGSNQIDVVVVSENNDKKTYTIFVTRNKGIDATLKELIVNGKNIIQEGISNYMLDDVDYNTTSLFIETTTNDPLASVSGDGLVNITTGDNEIIITVTAHDPNVVKYYKINVRRTENNDTGVKKIIVAGNEAIYNELTEKYEVTVPNNVATVNDQNVSVIVNDPVTENDAKATYIVPSLNLVTTTVNDLTIVVTAEDGTTKNYNVAITREKASIATLNSITVTNGSFNPSFNTETYEYDVTVPVETTEFDVAAVLTDLNANITSGVGHYEMTTSSTTVTIRVVSEDETVTSTYTLNITRTKSAVNTLSNITVTSGENDTLVNYDLTPEFNELTANYTVNVPGNIDSIDLAAELTDDRATLEGTGQKDLVVGTNTFEIKVKSESGAINTYTIKIERAKKNNNRLSTLTVDGVSVPNFDPSVTEYTLQNVQYNKSSVLVDATTEDEDAIVTGTGYKTLVTGPNSLKVEVTAQDGTKKVYTINIERDKNNNNFLSTLSVNGYTLLPNFDPSVDYYEVTVSSTKETLNPSDVSAVAQDRNAIVTKDPALTLSSANDNFYEIEVEAENGEKRVYTIKVIRPLSSDATIKSVAVDGASISPNFNPNKTEYVLTVPYGKNSFTITGTPTVSSTIVTGNGEYTIENSQVTLVGNAEDGTTKVYTFTIIQAKSNDAKLADLSVQGYPLDKTFQVNVPGYSIGEVPFGTEALIINAVTNNSDATLEYYVDGVKQTNNVVVLPQTLGEKTISVKVIAADGITNQTYTITYNLAYSDNTYLSKLESETVELGFLKTKENYTVNVANEITSISFDIETEDAKAFISINDGAVEKTPKTFTMNDLIVGNNTLKIKVVAEDGNSNKTYTIVINRALKEASTDASLGSLSVVDYEMTPVFNPDTLEYNIGSIPYSLENLIILATPNMGGSTIKYLVNGVAQDSNVVNVPKVTGSGAITVQVTAEDGKTIKNYKILYSKTPSSNAYLSSIVVSDGELEFNKDKFVYDVNVGREVTSIDITATIEDPTAEMTMNQTTVTSPHTMTISPLTSGDTEVIIVVTAEDGSFLSYTVRIHKEADIFEVITSIEYGHTILNGYIKTVRIDATGLDLKNQLDNPNEYLEIWDANNTNKINDTDKLATGMIVKLMIDGVEKDRKIVVIKGDTSGDGSINLFDAVKILNHYLEKTMLTDAYKEAAYVTDDTTINLFDSVKILNHYLEKESIF